MIIGKIEDGIVLDHIKAGQGMRLYGILNLDKLDCEVALIQNAPSVKMGRKDILKIDKLIDLNIDAVGYVDPGITVNIIREGKLAKRSHIDLPEEIVDIVKCKNPRCITTIEQELPHVFRLTDRENRVYRCKYCESKAE
ncbi:MAG: aspartate carbamoyltransferase regulatory subunit [Firmicutes bacterium]|jgi:aspartate carbamoyltransferase regulatory subunit|nr:aspartate carbamoyltransferase regulatory subunit [Bacillota bacterium]